MESQKNVRLILSILGGFACVNIFAWYLFFTTMQHQEDLKQQAINSNNMKIFSTAFENNQNLPSKYTCDAENINPPLTISETPENAKSLVLIVDDPDAPSGDWVHWLVWNIDPKTTAIKENSVPSGTQGQTDFGQNKWDGPCPPSGSHHYHFKIYALDTMLEIPATFKKAEVEEAMKNHIIDQSETVGIYQRK